ncbi:Signal-transducing adaptor protein 2 [Lemmus lemmus]
MASALSPPKGPKPKGLPPSHYYESFLEKKGPCDQDYRKFWAGLQGLAICFYNGNRDFQVLEKLDLRLFSKIKDESPWESSRDTSSHFSLVLRNQEVKFKWRGSASLWKGWCLGLVEKARPLGGRGLTLSISVLSLRCFLQVSRPEAQLLLERYPECGNLLLRPGGDGKDGVSVTTRQILNGSPVVKHYKVKREGPKYVIDVEDPFSCPSLDAVVNYFVTYTKRALVPFLMEEDYEKVLGFVDSDRENGENVWAVSSSRDSGPAPLANAPKPLPPVPVSVSSQEDRLPLPPLPQLPDQDENYVTPIEDSPAAEYVNQDVSSSSHPVPSKPRKPAKLPAKPPKPPIMPKPGKKTLGAWMHELGDITAELEEKLQKRRALEH